MSKKQVQEGLADLAQKVEHDHEVQMARADLYKIAKYAIKLHDMLRTVSEREGLKGWQQSKITKASDYISSVYHNLDYAMKFEEATEESVEEGKGSKKNKDQKKSAKHASMNEDEYKGAIAERLQKALLSEFHKKKLNEKPNAFQRGFNSMQTGNKFGPDSAERFIKGMFTGDNKYKNNDEPEQNTQDDTAKATKQPTQKKTAQQPAQQKQAIPFPVSTQGVQLKPGDKAVYTNEKGQTKTATVGKMLKTRDKQGNLQIQLKTGLDGVTTFAINRDNISKVNGKPWTSKE